VLNTISLFLHECSELVGCAASEESEHRRGLQLGLLIMGCESGAQMVERDSDPLENCLVSA
jgi:hypothetical protein